MNEQDSTDKLLDDVTEHIRRMPIPEYPGSPMLRTPLSERPSDTSATSHKSRRGALIAVCCCSAVLAVVLVVVSTTGDSDDRNRGAEIAQAAPAGNETVGPVHVHVVNPTAELDGMLLQRTSERLDQLEQEVALRDVRSDVAVLLAKFTPQQSDLW
ncbi:MAG: hypothetical protein ABGZ53_15950 [Fuerstiella sp.]|nr:hypothetical protein [Fuerstiella sp.]